jgi:hypothetical protein
VLVLVLAVVAVALVGILVLILRGWWRQREIQLLRRISSMLYGDGTS